MADTSLTFVIAAIILFIGFLGDVLLRKGGFPDIVFLIVFGIILGPLLGIFPKEILIPWSRINLPSRFFAVKVLLTPL